MARSRSPFVPQMGERMQAQASLEHGARRGADDDDGGQEVLLIHSQVRRIKREDEEARPERLLMLRLLETRPPAGGGFRGRLSASRSLSPLRRAGNAISVGE